MLELIKSKFQSIKGLLIITVFLTSLIPAILNYMFDFYLIYKESIKNAEQEIQIQLKDMSFVLENHYQQSTNILKTIIEIVDWENLNEAENIISRFQGNYWNVLFHHIFIMDSNGNILISPNYKTSNHKKEKMNLQNIDLKAEKIITDLNFYKEEGHFHPLLILKIPNTDYYIVGEIFLESLKYIFENELFHTYIVDLNKNNAYIYQNNVFSLLENFKDHQFSLYYFDQLQKDIIKCNFNKNHMQVNVYTCGIKKDHFIYLTEMKTEDIFSLIKIQIIRTTIVFFLLGIVIIYIIFKISNRFINPIHIIANGIEDMEKERGLSLTLEARTGIKETNLLVQKFNNLLEKIQNLIFDIRTTSENIDNLFVTVKNSSQTLEKASVDISSILEENSASLQEINTNMEDIENLGKKNYESAKEIQELIQMNLAKLNELGKNLENLGEISHNTADYTKESKNQSENLKNMIYSIQDTSERITEILSIIREISDRTNLLSLNASIEAARAGESGKGFAVVAQSISNLAETTEKSVQDIEELIEQTTSQMQQAIQFIDKSSEMMNKSYDMVASLDKEIQNSKNIIKTQLERSNKIFENSNKMNSIATDTFNSIKFIKNIIKEIHQSIDEASKLSIQFTEISRKLNTAVLNLDNDAKKLKRQIKRFSKDNN